MIDTNSPAAVIDWQRRLAAQPKVVVFAGDTGYADEQTGNLYASREAARLEGDWLIAHGDRARVSSIGSLHTFELSKERWQK